MKVEVDVLGSPSLTVLMVSVDVKQHWKKKLGWGGVGVGGGGWGHDGDLLPPRSPRLSNTDRFSIFESLVEQGSPHPGGPVGKLSPRT